MTEIDRHETTDVLIIGARCAGSAAAIGFAREGRSVIAVDRSVFPSDTLSTHTNFPSSVAEFQAVGALDRMLAHDPPRCTHGMVEADGARCLQKFAAVDGIDYGICLPRPASDMAMVETAREAGAEIREKASLEEVLWSDGRVSGAVVRERDGTRVRIDCKLLVGADGRRSSVARHVGAERPYRGSRNERGCAFWYMDDPKVGTVWRERLIQLRSGDTHALIFPTPDGRVLCLFMGPAVDIPAFRKDPEGMWERMLNANPAVRERLGGATNFSKLRSTGDNVAFFRRSSGPGWALAGDAGHFKDPIIGQGMRDAVRFGRILGEEVGPVLDDPAQTDAAARAVEARRDRECNATYHWGNRESRVFGVSPVIQEALTDLDGQDPPLLLHMFDRIQAPHRVLNPLRGAKYAARALLRRGVDRRAILREVLEEAKIDRDVWREELRPRFRSGRITASERADYAWPPRTPGVARAEPPADRAAGLAAAEEATAAREPTA
ncbi:MAG: FAD-dependent monooxygenase, partial [Solirubrobacterales bacterium]|nr:FAD-dependent monooxygenase [Solirubrobacterales bacterium]